MPGGRRRLIVRVPERVVTLSFDNGPEKGVTPFVLDVLKDRQATANFFVVGDRLRRTEGRAASDRALEEGQRIGGHTMTHSVPIGLLDEAEARHEITGTDELMGDLRHPEHLWRPYGKGWVTDDSIVGPNGARMLAEGGYTCVLWTSVPNRRDRAGRPGRTRPCRHRVDELVGRCAPRPSDRCDGPPSSLLRRVGPSWNRGACRHADSCTPLRRGVPAVSIGCGSSRGTRARFGGVERCGSEHTDGPQSPATRRNTPASLSLCAQIVASAGWVPCRQPQPPPVIATRDGAQPSIYDANTPNGEKTTRPSAPNRSAARPKRHHSSGAAPERKRAFLLTDPWVIRG